MPHTKLPQEQSFPKSGRVNEVCQEWMVREDSALAYRLQNQEFTDHLSGNRFRNAIVREDIPKARDEQLKEQEMAEQAAAIYHRMLQEQEEIDQQIAKNLADKIEREEKIKKKALELRDQNIARQMIEEEKFEKIEKQQSLSAAYLNQASQNSRHFSQLNSNQYSPQRQNSLSYTNLPNTSRRQSVPMPLPQENDSSKIIENSKPNYPLKNNGFLDGNIALYTEPYNPRNSRDKFNSIEVVKDVSDDLGIPLDELTLRQIQERKDAELARKLQEEEGNIEETLLNRDRMLAIEAQDKELAKVLQERERAKAKRAKEKAKQKALAKKQQLQQQNGNSSQILQQQIPGPIFPDDSYAFPADMITQPVFNVPRNISAVPDIYNVPNPEEEDISYSLPADVLFEGEKNSIGTQDSSSKRINGTPEKLIGGGSRPTHLDLRSPLNRTSKPRFPDPEPSDSANISSSSLSGGTSPIRSNIAMAIDPTYSKKGGVYRPSSSYDTTSSSVTTTTSSSSPGMLVSSDINEQDDESPAPPYMPIQGQRRTASLEKKKKKTKEGGCKQQ